MPVSNITASDLIIRATREIGAAEFGEVLTDDALLSGLQVLNTLLDSFEGEPYCIPYYTVILLTLLSNQDKYLIGLTDTADIKTRKIVSIQSARILYGSVWQPIFYRDQSYYDKSHIMTGYKSRPELVFLQNTVYESQVTFYPIPNIDYQCEIKGKQALDELELDDRLDEIPASMVDYLTYELCRRIAPSYSKTLTQDQQQLLTEAKAKVKRMANKSPLALTVSRGSSVTAYQRGERGY